MMKLELKVNEEYYHLVPRPAPEQYETLKKSIASEGLYYPITVNQNGVILDGHTRYDACKELGITPRYVVKKFDNEFDERRFVIIVNLSRRQLNLYQKGEVLYQWWVEEKRRGRERRGHHIWARRRGKTYRRTERLNKRLAEMLGCSHTTTCHLVWLLSNTDEKTKERLRVGTETVSGAYYRLRNKPRPSVVYKDRKYQRYPYCLKCSSRVEPIEKTGCHVHDKGCCTECAWGY